MEYLRTENNLLKSRLLCLEVIKYSEEKSQFWISLPNYLVFGAGCDYLKTCIPSSGLNYWKVKATVKSCASTSNFQLERVIRLNMQDLVEQIFTVCAYLTNFQLPVIIKALIALHEQGFVQVLNIRIVDNVCMLIVYQVISLQRQYCIHFLIILGHSYLIVYTNISGCLGFKNMSD